MGRNRNVEEVLPHSTGNLDENSYSQSEIKQKFTNLLSKHIKYFQVKKFISVCLKKIIPKSFLSPHNQKMLEKRMYTFLLIFKIF